MNNCKNKNAIPYLYIPKPLLLSTFLSSFLWNRKFKFCSCSAQNLSLLLYKINSSNLTLFRAAALGPSPVLAPLGISRLRPNDFRTYLSNLSRNWPKTGKIGSRVHESSNVVICRYVVLPPPPQRVTSDGVHYSTPEVPLWT